ncbi:MAG TPA: hypothetical protein VGY32_04595 [Solirubrobacteraceae bacterium]|nr:hypothetical protein [Solirubrobacteraceae bacterium]
MTRSRLIWPLLVAALAAGGVAWPAHAGATRAQPAVARVPHGFAGMVVDEPVWPDPWIDLQAQVDRMVASGVESLRVVFDWSVAQPYRSWNDVPPSQKSRFVNAGGVPTDFTAFDQLVSAASRDGLQVLPVVLAAPKWDGQTKKGAIVSIPRTPAPYAAFVKALVKRYGPGGSFWQAYPYRTSVPIRMWQIWNEPNIYPFWPFQPFEARYVALLAASRKAIKSVDPTAKVVLAGMPNYSWINLRRIYKIPGARSQFDVVAIHPYTKEPQGVITILGYVRQAMNQAGDTTKQIIADEISWPSSIGKTTHNTGYDFASTESGQAQKIKQVLPMLVANRKRLGLAGFYYYDWAGQERRNDLAFDFAGLFRESDGQFVVKPAYDAFRRGALAIEGCSSKGHIAASCNP